MTFTLRVTSSDIKLVDKTAIHRAMAKRYRQIVLGAFGVNGQHRPTTWSPLSDAYAKRIAKQGGTPVPTLYRRGAIFRSINDFASPEKGSVFTFNEIAAFHQFGTSKMPARPIFPFFRDGTPTPYAQQEVTRAAELEIKRQAS